jgi:formylglycine-generating enzyme required for sulfatase activity
MSDIFISYASEDRPRARTIAQALETEGWSVWWDRNIPAGKRFAQVIQEEIGKARCVVVLWSGISVTKDWVIEEASEGKKRQILVPVLVERVDLPWGFRLVQAADLSDWRGEPAHAMFRQLCQDISGLLGPAPKRPMEQAPLEKPKQGSPIAPTRPALWRRPRRWALSGGLITALACAGLLIYKLVGHVTTPPPAGGQPPVITIPRSEPTAAVGQPAAPITAPRTNPKDGLAYVYIPAGTFTMGCSPQDNECIDDEKPPHVVEIANGFWLGETEVTQAAWKKTMNNSPSRFKGDTLPVESVDWTQAGDYCKAIGGRLPTELEWEYAARAGTTGSRYGPLDAVAWYDRNSGATTHPVRLKQANAFGLYDMLGNVWEWTASDYDAGGWSKIVRGGSWGSLTGHIRASYRGWYQPTSRDVNVGFRCVGNFR